MTTPILWEASEQQKTASHLHDFMQWLGREKHLICSDYASLHEWSISDIDSFWRYFVEYTGLFSFPKDEPVVTVLGNDFIGANWFQGVTINYAEVIFRNARNDFPALVFADESSNQTIQIYWDELYARVASLATWLRDKGVKKGDRVVSILPNIPEAVIGFLATQSIGAVWSSCSPDFGNEAIVQRFAQVEPVVLLATNQTIYNGKTFDKREQLAHLRNSLPTVQEVILLDKIGNGSTDDKTTLWSDVLKIDGGELQFEPLPFDHPLWILYSSGTTGMPKAITHGVGGNLIEHMKVLLLHWDVRPGEKFFWYSTTGWMMWNFSVASLLVGATLVIYDGAPSYPTIDRVWQLAAKENIEHIGLGAAYLIHCQKADLKFNEHNFPALKTIGSTGSPLTPEAFSWVYTHVKKDVWLISFSGGTDVCSGFVGGSILLPVVKGEIQCRLLGCDLEAVDESGSAVRDQLGEMVIRKPMPSMPIYFWNDEGRQKYRNSYFKQFPGIWWHGDFITITSRGTVVIAGRSDATLNRDGVRIGTAEIYSVLDSFTAVADSLIVCLEEKDGSFFMPLFIKLEEGSTLTEELQKEIKLKLRSDCSPRHVPDAIYAVADIPYTISGKKMEIPVKRILMGIPLDKSASLDTVRNPLALVSFTQVVF